MAYKLLGWIVWKGGTWYLRRRLSGAARPAGALAVGIGVAGAAVAAARRRRG
jgi:hypothetical protein